MSLGSWPKIRVSVKMTYNVLEWEMTFQASNQFLMNMKVVHIVLKNIFSLGVISIWPTHKKLGLSVFQNSQMNWLINFSSPQLISWWIDDWGHSNKFKYAWNDELKNFPWLYLIMGWGCFKSKALWCTDELGFPWGTNLKPFDLLWSKWWIEMLGRHIWWMRALGIITMLAFIFSWPYLCTKDLLEAFDLVIAQATNKKC